MRHEDRGLPTRHMTRGARAALRLAGVALIVVPLWLLHLVGASTAGRPNGLAALILLLTLMVGSGVSGSYGIYLLRKARRVSWDQAEVPVKGLVTDLETRDRMRDLALAPGSKAAALSFVESDEQGRLSTQSLDGQLSDPEGARR